MDRNQPELASFAATFQAILPYRLKHDSQEHEPAKSKTTLLTLPVEIRKEILRYLLSVLRRRRYYKEWDRESSETFVKTCRRLNDPTTFQTFLSPSILGGGFADCFHEHTRCRLQPSLLRVCKQLYAEGRDILWNENKFLSIHCRDSIGHTIRDLIGDCCAFYVGRDEIRSGCHIHQVDEDESYISMPHPVVSIVMRNRNFHEYVYLFPMIEYHRIIRGLFIFCSAHHQTMASFFPMQITLGFGPNLNIPELNCAPDIAMHPLFFESTFLWLGRWIRTIYFCDEEAASSTPKELRNDPGLSPTLARLPHIHLSEHIDKQCTTLSHRLHDCVVSLEVGLDGAEVFDDLAEIVMQARAVWGSTWRVYPVEGTKKRTELIMTAAAWYIPFIEYNFDDPFRPVPIGFTRSQIFYGLLATRAMRSARFQQARVRLHLRLAMLFQRLRSECTFGYRQLYHAVWLFHYPSSADQAQKERAKIEISAARDAVLSRIHTVRETRKVWSGKRPLLEKAVVWGYHVGFMDSPETKKARLFMGDMFPEFRRPLPP